MMTKGLPEDRFWVDMTGMDRRSALAGTAFALGFAAACQPVAATTIRTSGDGIKERMGTLPAGPAGFELPVFIARPANKAKAPVVLVVQEIFGLHEWVKDIARRFAHAGYVAIAPDLFARVGDASKEADFKALFAKYVAPTSDTQVLADLDRAVVFSGTEGGDASRLAITGFCWGGRMVWLYAAHNPKLRAGVAYYGRLKSDPTPLQPTQPFALAGKLKAPVLGQYGARDKGIPVADVEAMQAALKAAGAKSRITLYPDADHGFMADYRPSYNEAASKAAWDATLKWFKAHGV